MSIGGAGIPQPVKSSTVAVLVKPITPATVRSRQARHACFVPPSFRAGRLPFPQHLHPFAYGRGCCAPKSLRLLVEVGCLADAARSRLPAEGRAGVRAGWARHRRGAWGRRGDSRPHRRRHRRSQLTNPEGLQRQHRASVRIIIDCLPVFAGCLLHEHLMPCQPYVSWGLCGPLYGDLVLPTRGASTIRVGHTTSHYFTSQSGND